MSHIEDPLWQERQRLFMRLKPFLDNFYHKYYLDKKGLTMDLRDKTIGDLAWSLINRKGKNDR